MRKWIWLSAVGICRLALAQDRPVLTFEVMHDDSQLAERVARALEANGRAALDVTLQHRAYLCGEEGKCPWAQGIFEGPIPASFPSEAEASLREGREACRLAQAGASPQARASRGCGSQVADVIWFEFLERQHARGFFTIWENPSHSVVGMSGFAIPDGAWQMLQDDEAAAPGSVEALVARFLQGEGGTASRRTRPTMPTAPSPSVQLTLPGRVALLPRVPFPPGCQGWPKLQVQPKRPVGETLIHRSMRDPVVAQMPATPVSCQLTGLLADETKPNRIQLACHRIWLPLERFTAEAELPGGLDDPQVMDEVTANLLSQLDTWICPLTPPQVMAKPTAPGGATAAGSPQPAAPSDVIVTIDSVQGLGSAIFQVSVHADGKVEYLGRRHVKVFGRRTGQLDSGALNELARSFEEARFLELDSSYNCRGFDDGGEATLTYSRDGHTNVIRHGLGCGPKLKPVEELERRVASVLHLEQWTGTPKEQRNAPDL